MQVKRPLLPFILLLPLALTGCVTTGGGSVTGGECKVFQAPPYAIRGATQHDQDWIDPTIESGVGGCKWARPAPRPADWDAIQAPSPKPHPAAKAKNKHAGGGWIWKALPTLAKNPEGPPAAPVAATPDPEPVAEAALPRSALDELLHPEAAVQ